MDGENQEYEYSNFGIFPWHFSAILLITAITLLLSTGTLRLDLRFTLLLAMFWFLTTIGWLNFLFRKVVVTEDGIVYKRTLSINFRIIYTSDWYFPFKSINRIQVKRNIVRIKYKKKTVNPSLIIIKDSKGFVEAIKKYAPDKLEVNK